jgi:4a-hydroxytetrahydrobiopterin dehydratase
MEEYMSVLNQDEINARLSRVNSWEFTGNKISKEFKLKDFKAALNFVNRVGDEAESMDHHPDILMHSWNKVRISVNTHSEGGITEKDFKLAEKIEAINK